MKIFIVFLLFFSLKAYPNVIELSERERLKYPTAGFFEEGEYLVPNENFFQDVVPVLNSTVPGIYISVGTERGFNGAAFSKATHLLLLDSDPAVVEFNRFIILLLKVSHGDREFYFKLRTDYKELVKYIASLNYEKAQNLTTGEIRFLDEYVHSDKYKNAHHDFLASGYFQIETHLDQPYGLSYFNDPEKFRKISLMASLDKIQAELFDFTNLNQVKLFVSKIKHKGLQVTVLDLSNIHNYIYSENVLVSALREFIGVSLSTTRIIITTNKGRVHWWSYKTSTFASLLKNGFFAKKIDESIDIDDPEKSEKEFLSFFSNSLNADTSSPTEIKHPKLTIFLQKLNTLFIKESNSCSGFFKLINSSKTAQ